MGLCACAQTPDSPISAARVVGDSVVGSIRSAGKIDNHSTLTEVVFEGAKPDNAPRRPAMVVANHSIGAKDTPFSSSVFTDCDELEEMADQRGYAIPVAFDHWPDELFDEALAEINLFRAQHGLAPVTLNRRLSSVAEGHLRDLAHADTVSHTGTDGSTLGERLKRGGYKARVAAENLSGGHASYHQAVHAWFQSPGHRKNLLLADVSQIGMAAVYDDDSRYQAFWALVVAKPQGWE